MTFRKHLSDFSLAATLVLIATQFAFAQAPPAVRLPRPSQKATVMQTIGVTDVTITYSRPGVKGRRIWGDAVASQVDQRRSHARRSKCSSKRCANCALGSRLAYWRKRSNSVCITDDVLINGQKLAAGSYSLHTIPTKDEWTLFSMARQTNGAASITIRRKTLSRKSQAAMAKRQSGMAGIFVSSRHAKLGAGSDSVGKSCGAFHGGSTQC